MSNEATPAQVRNDGLRPFVEAVQAEMRNFANAHTFLGGCERSRVATDESLSQAINAYRRAAVAAERERRQIDRDELVAAWNDLPDALRCHPGLQRLYAAAQRA